MRRQSRVKRLRPPSPVTLETLTDDEFAEIHSALLEFGFLVFPGQFLSDEGSIAFEVVSGS